MYKKYQNGKKINYNPSGKEIKLLLQPFEVTFYSKIYWSHDGNKRLFIHSHTNISTSAAYKYVTRLTYELEKFADKLNGCPPGIPRAGVEHKGIKSA